MYLDNPKLIGTRDVTHDWEFGDRTPRCSRCGRRLTIAPILTFREFIEEEKKEKEKGLKKVAK